MKIELDYEKLMELSPEEYCAFVNRLVNKFSKLITEAQEDYLRKKGKTRRELTGRELMNMQKAINNRKSLKCSRQLIMNLNFYPMIGRKIN